MNIDNFIYRRNELKREIQDLYSLKDKVYNVRSYPIHIGHGRDAVPLKTKRWSLSPESRDVIMEDIEGKIKEINQELADLESKVVINS